VGIGVFIADPREVVVARIGVAALAVGQVVAEGVVVIALDALDLILVQQRKDPVGMGAEGPHVAETVTPVHAAAPDIR
jgi:hypothetical protein